MAITVVLLMTVIFGMAALAVDASQLYMVRTQDQNAADAAALAGAAMLDGTGAGIDDAVAAVQAYAGKNRAYSGAAVVAAANIEFGNWTQVDAQGDPVDNPYTAIGDAAAAKAVPLQANAVRVKAGGTTGTQVHNPFAAVLGQGTSSVSASATATGCGPAEQCSFPMVVADCSVGSTPSSCFQFQNNNDDTAGWSSLTYADNVSPGTVADLMEAGCSNLLPGCAGFDPDATECAGTCKSPVVGTEVHLNNGNYMNEGGASYNEDNCGASLNNPCEVIKQILLRKNSALTETVDANGKTVLAGAWFTTKVPIIEGNGQGCSAQFSNRKPIVGYTDIDVFAVQCGNTGGGPKSVVGAKGGGGGGGGGAAKKPVTDTAYVADHASELTSIDCNPPSGDHVLAREHAELEVPNPGGGGCLGISSTRSRLVQ